MQEIKNISAYRQSLKDKILETSMSLFAEKGIRAVKMDDIANRLSISKRTLYEIYADKEMLLFEGVKKFHRMKREQMKNIAQNSDNVMDIILDVYKLHMEQFRITTPVFYSDLEKYPKILEYFDEEAKEQHTLFLDFLKRGISEGFFRDDLNYDIIACMFDAIGKYIMSNQLYNHYTMGEIMANVIFVMLRGFCTLRGAKVLDSFLDE